jgi:hypothetical protein
LPIKASSKTTSVVNVLPKSGSIKVGTTSHTAEAAPIKPYSIYPNPSSGVVNIDYNAANTESLQVEFFAADLRSIRRVRGSDKGHILRTDFSELGVNQVIYAKIVIGDEVYFERVLVLR